jgi:hypothetical protein
MSLLLRVADLNSVIVPPVEDASPTEVIWPGSKERVRHLQPYRSRRVPIAPEYSTEDIFDPVDSDHIAQPVPRATPSLPKQDYAGATSREIASAAIIEAQRRLSEDIAAKAASDEQARQVAFADAKAALAEAARQAELTAMAVRRAQDEDALIALLLAM